MFDNQTNLSNVLMLSATCLSLAISLCSRAANNSLTVFLRWALEGQVVVPVTPLPPCEEVSDVTGLLASNNDESAVSSVKCTTENPCQKKKNTYRKQSTKKNQMDLIPAI